jgi:hypothetical protein
LQTYSQLDRIVVGPEMDKKETGLFVEHVAVNGGHLNAVVMQGADQRIHFVGDYDEVTGDRGLPISRDSMAAKSRDSPISKITVGRPLP